MKRVIIADDHRMFRDGLRALLAAVPELEVVAEAENGCQAVELTAKLKPDLVIMDIGMPDLNGIEAARRICRENPQIKVVALSVHNSSRYVAQMLEAGASGYVVKDCAFEELERAIAVTLEGRIYLSPQAAQTIVGDFLDFQAGKTVSREPLLTEREREVLQLFAEGGSTKEIAAGMHVSPKTVETHRKRIMDKLGIRSIAELTKYAIREGITFLDEK